MKLDSRIKSLSDILTCFDTEQAKQFKGEKGYFADALGEFKNLKGCKYGELVECERDSYYQYWCRVRKPGYAFYIPESILKLEEIKADEPLTQKCMNEIIDLKKYRPYTFEEFKSKFLVGQPITFRKKGEEGCEVYSLLDGYRHDQCKGQTITYIYIGYRTYTLYELFENYEWQASDSEEFKPFGVET